MRQSAPANHPTDGADMHAQATQSYLDIKGIKRARRFDDQLTPL